VALAATVFALFARTFVLQIYTVPSASMAPTLMVGDHVLVNKFVFRAEGALLPRRAVDRGEVVVFRWQEGERFETLVKRCVGVGGDRVAMVEKVLAVNGLVHQEPYASSQDPRVFPRSDFVPSELRTRDNFGPWQVAAEEIFVLGDNRDLSRDSRSFGSIRRERVVGQAVLVLWSRSGEPPAEGTWLRGSWLARSHLGSSLAHLERIARSVRWSRVAMVVR
jgi:signal peptidase I